MAARIILRNSGRQEPQFVPACNRAPIACVVLAPAAMAVSIARDFTPKHAQMVGLESKSPDAALPARSKWRAVASSRSERQAAASTLQAGTSPSRPMNKTAAIRPSAIKAAQKTPRAGSR
jgi:hypothetical protein